MWQSEKKVYTLTNYRACLQPNFHIYPLIDVMLNQLKTPYMRPDDSAFCRIVDYESSYDAFSHKIREAFKPNDCSDDIKLTVVLLPEPNDIEVKLNKSNYLKKMKLSHSLKVIMHKPIQFVVSCTWEEDDLLKGFRVVPLFLPSVDTVKAAMHLQSKNVISDELFEKLYKPLPAPCYETDWLCRHPVPLEPAYEYEQFDKVYGSIELLPINVTSKNKNIFETLLPIFVDYTKRFFQVPNIIVGKSLKIKSNDVEDILEFLNKKKSNSVACLMGLTADKLLSEGYITDGFSDSETQCGIMSFYVYLNEWTNAKLSKPYALYYPLCTTLVHEICHLYGMYHCTYCDCLMRGCGNPIELYTTCPLLCPVCLAKLSATYEENLDIKLRYNQLFEFCSMYNYAPHFNSYTNHLIKLLKN